VLGLRVSEINCLYYQNKFRLILTINVSFGKGHLDEKES
jgi:hypothetical protein